MVRPVDTSGLEYAHPKVNRFSMLFLHWNYTVQLPSERPYKNLLLAKTIFMTWQAAAQGYMLILQSLFICVCYVYQSIASQLLSGSFFLALWHGHSL